MACKCTLSLCRKGVNLGVLRDRDRCRIPGVSCTSVRKAESRIGAGFTPMLPCTQDLDGSGMSGPPGREETQFRGATQYVDNGCVSSRRGRNDEGRTVRHSRFLAWYRFRVVRLLPLRLAGRHHRRAVLLGLSAGNPRHLRAAGFRRRLPRAPVRRDRVRPGRRHRRPQIHLPRHHPDHGSVDLHRRPAAQRGDHRHRGTDHPDRVAPRSGPGARRRIWRCGDLCRGARAKRQARLLHLLHPDDRHARPVPVAAGDPVHPQRARRNRLRGLGLAHSVPGLGAAARRLGLDPAAAE